MTKTSKAARQPQNAERMAQETKAEETTTTTQQETKTMDAWEQAEAEAYATIAQPKAPGPKTVVGTGYKNKYRAMAKAEGRKDKASARGCGDWLQRELQAETIVKGEFDFDRFLAILDANGVDYSRWNTTTHGWKGRFRMSGGIVLRGIVGKTGVFRTPDAEHNLAEIPEAAEFLSKWAN